MTTEKNIVSELEQQATSAWGNISGPSKLAGKAGFRKEWYEHGPKDALFAVETYRENKREYNAKRKKRNREDGKAKRIKTLTNKSEGMHTEKPITLADADADAEIERLRAELSELRKDVKEQVAELENQKEEQEQELEPLRIQVDEGQREAESLKKELRKRQETLEERRGSVQKLREKLHEQQEAIRRLDPLLGAAKREYGMDEKGKRDV